MPIGATLFSGGRGVEMLLKDDIDFRYSVEYDPAIAAVGAQLGGHTIVGDVRDVDYTTWGRLDYLHASPVCKNFSAAKSSGVESDDDMSAAAAVVRCLDVTQPKVFTLENVQQYEGSASYRLIVNWLNHNGYMWHAETLNAANYGVPQTRRRLILRAVRDALLPGLPPPVKWVGWYAAIEDLIPTLPDSKFAPWQLARLPEELQTFMIASDNTQQEWGDPCVPQGSPARTIRVGSSPRAFIDGIRQGAEPMLSVTAQSGGRARAWLVESRNLTGAGNIMVYPDKEPAMTIPATAQKGMPRAWLAHGRVVKMTPRALARFQSIPDWYQLPDKSSLACTIIGNAVPPLLMRAVVLPLL